MALAQGEFLFRRVDKIRVVGQQEPVVISELLGRRSVLDRSEDGRLRAFDTVLHAYDRRDWNGALRQVDQYRAAYSGADPVVDVYEVRCRQFSTSPPPEDWDGVYTFTSK